MKALIFLIVIASVIAAIMWYLRKTQAEEIRSRHEAVERRKKNDKVALTPTEDVTWPVIIKPVKGDSPEEDTAVEEPSMTAIEFEPAEQVKSQQS